MKLTIDAQGKKVGRVASEAAAFLRGKNDPSFEPNKLPNNQVEIVNASKADIDQKKKGEKVYTHYTGYPGGLRERKMSKVIDSLGYADVFRRAVYGMLPANRLRSRAMKQLTIKE